MGPIIFIPSISCLLLALQFGGVQFPWTSPVVISLFCGFGVILLIWVYTQVRLGERATVPISLITDRTVLFSSTFSFFTGSAFPILSFYIPFFFQAVKGSSATGSAVESLPLIISINISAIGGGILISATGYLKPFMIVGMVGFIIGTGLLSTLGVNTPVSQWLPYEILSGIGMGINQQV